MKQVLIREGEVVVEEIPAPLGGKGSVLAEASYSLISVGTEMSKDSKRYIMIVGGNFIGKGAEAMMLTVQDAIKQNIPEVVCFVPLVREADRQQLESYGFEIVKQRRQGRVVKVVSLGLAMTRLLRQRRIDLTAAKEKGIANIFRG
jgi:hypothetical protein